MHPADRKTRQVAFPLFRPRTRSIRRSHLLISALGRIQPLPVICDRQAVKCRHTRSRVCYIRTLRAIPAAGRKKWSSQMFLATSFVLTQKSRGTFSVYICAQWGPGSLELSGQAGVPEKIRVLVQVLRYPTPGDSRVYRYVYIDAVHCATQIAT